MRTAPKNITELLASIDLCNNGYIFSPSLAELDLAYQHPDQVTVERGNIKRISTKIEYYPGETPLQRAWRFDPINDHDYEGAILSRQEADQRYW